MTHSYQDTKQKAMINICALVTRKNVPKMTYNRMEFRQHSDLSNYISSCIQYFHMDKIIYNIYHIIVTLIHKYSATMDITHRQDKEYQQLICFMTSIIISQQYPKSKTRFLSCIMFKQYQI